MKRTWQYYPHLEKQGYESRRFRLGEFLEGVVNPEKAFDRDDIPLQTFLVESPDSTGERYDRAEFTHMWALQLDFDSGLPWEGFDFDHVLWASPRSKPDHLKYRVWIPLDEDLDLCILDNPAARTHLYRLFPGSDEGVTKKTFQRHRCPSTLDGFGHYFYRVQLTGKLWNLKKELEPVHLANPVRHTATADIAPMGMATRALARNLAREIASRGSYERGSGLHEFLLSVTAKARHAGIPEEVYRGMWSAIALPDEGELDRITEYFYSR